MRRCLAWMVIAVVGGLTALALWWTAPDSPWAPATGTLTVVALMQTAGWLRWTEGYRQGARNVIRAVELTRRATERPSEGLPPFTRGHGG